MNIYYLLTLLFLLLSCKANFFFYTDAVWLALEAVLLAVGVYRKRITHRDVKLILVFSGVYLAYVLFRFPFNGLPISYLVSDFFFLMKFLVTAYLFCVVLREKTLFYLVKVITHLAALSLVFFALQFVGGGKILQATGGAVNALVPNLSGGGYTNFFVFTYDSLHWYRNSGFCWEPGAFGCFLCLASLFNFFQNGFRFDRDAIILAIALLTTFSTTSYFAFSLILLLRFRYRNPKNKAALIGFGLVMLVAVPNISFLGEKIVEIYKKDLADLENIHTLSKYYEEVQRELPLNRFGSIIFLHEKFGQKLWLGVSNQYDQVYRSNLNINISNGVMDFSAKFGYLGLLFLFYRFSRLCKQYVKNWEYVLYCVLALLVLGFGEPIFILPICLLFIFLPGYTLSSSLQRLDLRSTQNPELAFPVYV
ncbi:MAG: hypothetical protein WBG71_12870 [Leeuwenhoekiella sp.]